MKKVIFSIRTRNKSFNLLQQMNKDFGVVFHPKSTLGDVCRVKETLDAKDTTEASGQVRQDSCQRAALVGTAKEDKVQEEADGWEVTSNKVSSSYTSLERKK